MKSRLLFSGMSVALMFLISTLANAQPPVRKASKNGVNSSQPTMNLFGPTAPVTRGDATLSVQYICPNQDVADSNPANFDDADPSHPDTLKLSGSCTSGLYKFLFQVQPKRKFNNLNVIITDLVGFTPGTDDTVDFNNPTYGVQVCDDGGNTLELCTKLAPEALPVITTSVNAKHGKVQFTAKKVSPTTAPAGVDYEGQGLTFEVLVQLTPKTPIALPTVTVK
jgi:hypothetical protein